MICIITRLKLVVVISPGPISNPKLKQKSLYYTITLCDGHTILNCASLDVLVFDYADPAFPDNLLGSLPVLALSGA